MNRELAKQLITERESESITLRTMADEFRLAKNLVHLPFRILPDSYYDDAINRYNQMKQLVDREIADLKAILE